MQCYDGALIVARSFFIAAGSVLLFSVSNAAAQGPGDNIEVMVCPAANQSSFLVTGPQSDSVVNGPKVLIKGTVEYISQIDFFIDDVYNNTVALGYSETAFESLMTLSPGTHTIKFTATDSCSQTTRNDSLVITYQPKTQPSIGEEVETEVDNIIVNPDNQTTAQPEKTAIERTIDRFIAPPFVAIAKTLDLVEPVETDSATRLEDTARSTLFVTGATLTFSAAYVGVTATLPAHLSFLMKFRRRAMSAIATIGLALISLVFML